MKWRTTFISIILSLLSIPSLAQFRAILKNADEIEISAGPGLVSLHNRNIAGDTRQPKIGYSARLGVLYTINKSFSLKTSLLYDRKGVKNRYDVFHYDPTIDSTNCKCTTSLGTTEVNANLDYISFAILMRGMISANLYFEGGAFVGHLFKARVEQRYLWDNSHQVNDIRYLYKRTDCGVALSIGYKVFVTQKAIVHILLSDNYGLLNIVNEKISQSIVKTNSISLLLGLAITFSKN